MSKSGFVKQMVDLLIVKKSVIFYFGMLLKIVHIHYRGFIFKCEPHKQTAWHLTKQEASYLL